MLTKYRAILGDKLSENGATLETIDFNNESHVEAFKQAGMAAVSGSSLPEDFITQKNTLNAESWSGKGIRSQLESMLNTTFWTVRAERIHRSPFLLDGGTLLERSIDPEEITEMKKEFRSIYQLPEGHGE